MQDKFLATWTEMTQTNRQITEEARKSNQAFQLAVARAVSQPADAPDLANRVNNIEQKMQSVDAKLDAILAKISS